MRRAITKSTASKSDKLGVNQGLGFRVWGLGLAWLKKFARTFAAVMLLTFITCNHSVGHGKGRPQGLVGLSQFLLGATCVRVAALRSACRDFLFSKRTRVEFSPGSSPRTQRLRGKGSSEVHWRLKVGASVGVSLLLR